MKKLLIGLFALFAATGAMAGDYPINFSLTPDVALHQRTDSITGLTLSVWGENYQQSLALGIVNGTDGHSTGVSLGIVNYGDSYSGLQWGIVNHVEHDFDGWQGGPFFGLLISVVNYTGGEMSGLQTGFVNLAGTLHGLQLGFFNRAQAANGGVQIGVINIIDENMAWFDDLPRDLAPAMVLVNWRF